MKNKLKKIIAFLTILGVCVCVCACSGGESGIADSDEEILLEAGGDAVYTDEARYYAYTRQASYEAYYIAYGQDIDWQSEYESGVTYEDAVKDSVLEDMCRRLAVKSYAERYDVSTDEEDEAQAAEKAAKYFEDSSEQLTAAVNITEERLCDVFRSEILFDKVCDAYLEESGIEISPDDCRQAAISFIQIDVEGDGEEDADEKSAEKCEAVAKKIVHDIKDGVSIEEAAAEYGYEVILGNIGENDNDGSAFAQTALSLAAGDSDWIAENDTYYVIYCDLEYDEEATLEAYEEALDDEREEAADAMYSEWKESAEVRIDNDLWENINFSSHIFVLQS